MYLLTDWEGRMGKRVALGYNVKTENRKVRASSRALKSSILYWVS